MKRYIVLLIGTLMFLLGWLFPVEGPYDYVYDNAVAKRQKTPVKAAPIQKPPKEEIDIRELTEEDYIEFLKEFHLLEEE